MVLVVFAVVTDLGEEVRALDVEMVALVEVGLGRGLEILQEHDAGAGDQDVDSAEFGHRFRDHEFNVLDAAGVAFDQ